MKLTTHETRFNKNVIFCHGDLTEDYLFCNIAVTSPLYFCRIKISKKMTMKKHLILSGMLACFGISAKAQDTKIEEPKGKALPHSPPSPTRVFRCSRVVTRSIF